MEAIPRIKYYEAHGHVGYLWHQGERGYPSKDKANPCLLPPSYAIMPSGDGHMIVCKSTNLAVPRGEKVFLDEVEEFNKPKYEVVK